MFNISDKNKDSYMLDGSLVYKGYDWWWHSFTAVNRETGEEVPFFIEYFLINPELGGDEPVYGQLEENREKGIKPSYLMIKAGCWGKGKKQLHRFFGWNSVRITTGAPFKIEAGDCLVSEYELKGSVSVSSEDAESHPEYMSDAGSMKWDLQLNKLISFNVGYGAGRVFRDLKAFEMYWHAEGMKSIYSGSIVLDGTDYDVIPSRSYGYADKNWGRGFTSPWVWLSSNCLESRLTGKKLYNSAFDIGGGRPKIYALPLERKLLGGFCHEGREYEYNFSKFWQMPETRFSFREDDTYVYWKVWQSNLDSVMKTDVRCKKEDMLWVNYEDPDGNRLHRRLWNGGNGTGRVRLYHRTRYGLLLIDDIYATHVGCEYGEYDAEDE